MLISLHDCLNTLRKCRFLSFQKASSFDLRPHVELLERTLAGLSRRHCSQVLMVFS